MPGLLLHSPADVLRQLLVDMSLAVDYVDDRTSWAAFASGEPDLPDDSITIYDTEGREHGRDMPTGERATHDGFQIRVRSRNHKVGYIRARLIAIALDEEVENVQVDVDDNSYLVKAVTRTGGILPIGKDIPGSKRNLFTINGVISLRSITPLGFPWLTEDGFGWQLEDSSGFYLLEGL